MASVSAINGTTNRSDDGASDTKLLDSPRISGLTEYNSLDPLSPRPSFKGIPMSFLLPDGHPDYLRLILTSRVYEITEATPLSSAINLSSTLGVRVVLKREDLQPVFSFKIRGAYNKMAHIPEEERWKGVVACSAGVPRREMC
jgi:threonine dehydratase